MNLNTAIVPPRHVLDEVLAAVHAACRPEQPSAPGPLEPQSPSRARWMSRRPRTVAPGAPAAAAPVLGQLDLVPVEGMFIPVAGFGNVTAGDVRRITAALARVAAETPRPTIRLAGGAALEFDGDRHVWVRVTGDTDALRSATQRLTSAVEKLGFYVDRRKFRPLLAVATVNDTTTPEYLQRVVDALDTFSGQPWELEHVQLMRLTYGTGPEAQEVDRLPLLD